MHSDEVCRMVEKWRHLHIKKTYLFQMKDISLDSEGRSTLPQKDIVVDCILFVFYCGYTLLTMFWYNSQRQEHFWAENVQN